MSKKLYVFTDGGARGNPGPAAVGFVIKDSHGKILTQKGKFIGKTTNNVAEYTAIIEALKWLKVNLINSVDLISSINFFIDSKLIVCQLNGLYKIKKCHLRNLVIMVRKLEQELGLPASYNQVSREKNKDADFLVNKILNIHNP